MDMDSLSNKYSKQEQLRIINFSYFLENFANGGLIAELRTELNFDQFAESMEYILQKIMNLSLNSFDPQIQDQARIYAQNQQEEKALELLNQAFLENPSQYSLVVEKGIELGVGVMKTYFFLD